MTKPRKALILLNETPYYHFTASPAVYAVRFSVA
jgi:hypothetical protein